MNRQTLAVTLGTLALVVIGALLLYATPAPEGSQRPEAKAEKAKGGKITPQPAKALPPERLVHARELPADRPAAPAGAPNVVLVVASTQRRDQWSAYGGQPTVTPFLAARSEEGVRMEDALAVAVDPRPADAAIVTGRYPHAVGVIEPGDRKNVRPILASVETVSERFAAAGWFTVGLTANHHLNARAGGAQGFDWYRDSQPYSLMQDQRIDAAELVRHTLDRVAARTEAERARPLYLQLALVDSHKPLRIPPAEFERFKGDGTEIAPYRATLFRLDDAVQRLVEGLAGHGVTAADTVFAVVGDHGEGLDMPAHHRKQHGFVLYESSVRVPWILWGKGVPAGRVVPGLASVIDVAPTLLGLAGVAGQAGFDGLDLSGAIRGGGATGRERAYADTLYEGVHRASIWTSTRQCQEDYGSTKKMDDDTFEDACYDREADPDFTKPVADAPLAAELDAMHAKLMETAAAATAAAPPEED